MCEIHILQILPMYHVHGEEILKRSAKVTKFVTFNEQEIIRFLHDNEDVDGIILRAPAKITRAIIDACKNVKAISGAGVGLDNIDVDYATKKGIPVLHAPKLNSQATAEHTVCLILATMKNLIQFHQETKKGNFNFRDGQFTYEVKGKTLGLVGFGTIAQKVAKIMRVGFDMEVIAYVREMNQKKMEIAKSLDLKLTTSIHEVFKESDIVSLHIPLTNDTRNMLNKEFFHMMKPTAVLINTARGGIINEIDLYEALKEKKIFRAGIDVFSEEPPNKNHPFFELDEVIMTPHMGGISVEAARKTSEIIAENLIKTIKGEKPSTMVNYNQLFG
ncbi:hydroxyacid dehydrogenase [Caldifermentibacillus hisashii]|uniref:Hydroxyacid dehydrogenase n=1 Tax=Caldifermentibacillus hisashii TaxID=996558 RepID=A0ABU9K177_9BACI|nr:MULTISPECIES: hydroxyacid dehydrogenase [Bacillaceae]MCM3477516.1 hydroxyacid dehydrogenase [Caldibacillus thermoamylovorans]MEC5271704.1 hydroxyacid dehydrogenase [Caldifermentibacillus hisashii]